MELPWEPRLEVVRLEEVSTNYSSCMLRAFSALLPTLGLVPHVTSTAISTPSTRGMAAAASAPSSSLSSMPLQVSLVEAVSRFDLSRNAPTPDKAAHVSDKTAKKELRDALLRDGRLRMLLKGLRQVLEYENLPAWQPPPDLPKLSSAIDGRMREFYKALGSGSLAASIQKSRASFTGKSVAGPAMPMA